MLKATIVNPNDGRRVLVDPSRAMLVEQRPVPPFGAPLDAVVLRGFLRDESGSEDMTVLASPASPVVFSVRADSRADLYIKSLLFSITGTDMTLADFGSIAALTDPCILAYDTGTQRVILDAAITTNFDLLRLGGELMPGVGGSPADALKTSSPAMGMSTDDAYNAFIDFERVYGFPFGIRLEQGTDQRLDFLIQDDLTGIDTFACNVFGFSRGPDTERA